LDCGRQKPGQVPEDSGFAHTTAPGKNYAGAPSAQQYLRLQVSDYAIARDKGFLFRVHRITCAKHLQNRLLSHNCLSFPEL
jgi:hypothetical protein